MKFALALAMVAAGVAARAPRSHELEGYTYEQYARDFGKVVSASGAANFARELKQILEHNRREGVTFRRGVNQYTDMEAPPRGMRRELLGHHRATSAAARPTPAEALPFALKPIEQLPPSVDWRERGVVTAVKDQGGCGSCWAFATTAVMESHVALATGTLFNLAPQELVSCMDNPSECGGTGGCAGATCELGYEFYMTNGGVVQEYQMGYTSYYGEDGACYLENSTRAAAGRGRSLRGGGPDPEGITTGVANITGYTVLPSNNESALMNALASVGPVAITVAAMDWKNYEGGVYAPDAFDGRLIIAGEATCRRMFATVHGAFVSGLRAARSLLGDARAASRADWREFLDERTIAECDSRAPAPADDGGGVRARRRAYRQLDALLRAADK